MGRRVSIPLVIVLKAWAGTWCVSCMWFPVSTECNHVLISIFKETSRNSLPSCDWVGNRLATAARLSYACIFLGYVISIVLRFLLCLLLLSCYFLVLSCLVFFFLDRMLLYCPTHHLWCSSLGAERYRMGGEIETRQSANDVWSGSNRSITIVSKYSSATYWCDIAGLVTAKLLYSIVNRMVPYQQHVNCCTRITRFYFRIF